MLHIQCGPICCTKLTTTNFVTSNHQHLRGLYCNARPLPRHALEIWSLLDSEKPDFLFISETWLHETSQPDIAIAIPQEYQLTRLKRGGGIAIAFRANTKVHTLEAFQADWGEICIFTIESTSSKSWRGALIYRPPGTEPFFPAT